MQHGSWESRRALIARNFLFADLTASELDKVLALGRGDEAERIIGPYLRNYLASAQKANATSAARARTVFVTACVTLTAQERRRAVDKAMETPVSRNAPGDDPA